MKTYNYILKLIYYKPGLFIINGVLWILIHLSPLIPGLITKEFFDELTGSSTLNLGIWGIVALLTAASLGRIIVIFSGALTDVLHRFTMSSLIRYNLFDNILSTSSNKSKVGDLIIHFREDADQAENSVSWTLDVTGKFLFAIVSFIILINISVKITLTVFIPLILVIIVANKASNRLEKYRAESRKASSYVAGAIGEYASISQAISLAGAEDRVVNRLDKLNQNRRNMMVKDSVLTQGLNSIFNNTVSLGTGIILIMSAASLKDGTFTVGDFSLFVYYLAFITEFTNFFGMFMAHYKQTGVSFARMSNLFKKGDEGKLVNHSQLYFKGGEPKDPPETQYQELDELKVENLHYTYPNSNNGIKDINLSIKKGTFNVITGRTGSGKTTLLRSIMGSIPTDRGTVYYNEEQIYNPLEFFKPPISAYTPQVPTLFSDTLKENILLGVPMIDEDLTKPINMAALDKDLVNLDNGLETMVGSNGVNLSGGQIQRTAIARMFARNAELYMMDDISSALDVNTEKQVWDNIENKLNTNSTFIVISHSKECLLRADKVIVMKEGKIESQGDYKELMKTSNELRSLLQEERLA